MATYSVILAAAGKSSRFRDKHYKKPFAPLADRAVWIHSAEKFLNRDDVKQLIIIISPEDRETFDAKFSANVAILGIQVVAGGQEREDSIANALPHVRPDVDFVAVHDAARPCLATEWIDQVFAAAETSGAAILAIPVSGTLKRVGNDRRIVETVSRAGLWEAQTPQVFRRAIAARRVCPPWWRAGHRRRGAGPTDGAPRHDRAGLTHQPEDHHPRGSAVCRACAQGTAQTQNPGPLPSICRRRPVALTTA